MRLDRLSKSIEAFLERDQRGTEAGESSSSGSERQSLSSDSEGPPNQPHVLSPERELGSSGTLYFHAPPPLEKRIASPQQIQQEMQRAVPLSQVLAVQGEGQKVPMRTSIGGSSMMRRSSSTPHSFLQQPLLPPVAHPRLPHDGTGGDEDTGVPIALVPNVEAGASERLRRTLVNREATNFDYVGGTDSMTPSVEAYRGFAEDRVIPLIPFSELMLVETLAVGRASTIYRAAWHRKSQTEGDTPIENVEVVALKVATIDSETEDFSQIEELRREADIAAILKHPNVCDIVGVATDSEYVLAVIDSLAMIS